MEFFLVKIFTEFSSKKYSKLRFPSVIPFIMRATGRPSFVVGMAHGTVILVETSG